MELGEVYRDRDSRTNCLIFCIKGSSSMDLWNWDQAKDIVDFSNNDYIQMGQDNKQKWLYVLLDENDPPDERTISRVKRIISTLKAGEYLGDPSEFQKHLEDRKRELIVNELSEIIVRLEAYFGISWENSENHALIKTVENLSKGRQTIELEEDFSGFIDEVESSLFRWWEDYSETSGFNDRQKLSHFKANQNELRQDAMLALDIQGGLDNRSRVALDHVILLSLDYEQGEMTLSEDLLKRNWDNYSKKFNLELF